MTTGAARLPLVIKPSEAFPQLAPQKPRRMSEKAYRELYDSQPLVVAAEPPAGSKKASVRLVAAGLVSAQHVACTYHRLGYSITVESVQTSR